MKLNERNVLNILHKAKFSDSDWAQLGLQLIQNFDLKTIRADHDRTIDCMIETIAQWLRTDAAKTDTKASWEKLADAVTWVRGYGEATAAIVLQKAGIVHTRMLTVLHVYMSDYQHLASFPGLFTIQFDRCILAVCSQKA